jgi:hypothetical protein
LQNLLFAQRRFVDLTGTGLVADLPLLQSADQSLDGDVVALIRRVEQFGDGLILIHHHNIGQPIAG